MSEKTIAEKLLLKPGRRLLVLNAPAGYLERIGPLPDFARIVEPAESADVIQLFIYSLTDLDSKLPETVPLVKDETIFWICYPKKFRSLQTEIDRNILYTYIGLKGWKGIGMISVDNNWSAMRIKPQ
jgi:hypothetical protein